jgi:hypothetical protein
VKLFPVQLHTLAFAVFASMIAPFGGFFASAVKRAYKKKVRRSYRIVLHANIASNRTLIPFSLDMVA